MPRLLLWLLPLALCAQEYDLLLKNGTLIDPKNRINARRDVAIAGGKIAAVAPSIPAASAKKTVDVNGLYVTPGLIDIHVHVYAGTGKRGAYNGDLSVYPDAHCLRNGVTTVADCGSSGRRDFEDFKDRVIDRSKTRVLAWLNIVGYGMGGANEQKLDDMDAALAAEMAKKHKDVIIGIKTAHYNGREWTPVERAVEAGKLAGVPVMVDFGTFRPERPFEELVTKKLRPGDIYTHCYLSFVPILDESGKVRPYLFEARKRGVLFDVGHGGGSFLWRQAAPAVAQGFMADSISTDLHVSSMMGGMKDMTNVMSKFLALGLPFDDVILRSTWNPAKEIQREDLGHLSVGAIADVAVLRVQTGQFGFVDVHGAKKTGTKKLVAELTVKDGKVLYDLNGLTREEWDKLPKGYMAQGDPAWDATLSGAMRTRKK